MKVFPNSAGELLKTMTRPYRAKIVVFFMLCFLGILCWSASPFIVRNIVNELSEHKSVSTYVWVLALLFFLLRFFDEMFWRLAEYLMRSFKPQMIESVRYSLFAEVLKKPHKYFVDSSSGRIGHWINQTTSTANEVVDTTIWSVFGRTVGLLLAAGFLCLAHWKLAVLFVIWLVLLFWFTIKRGRKFGELVGKQSDEVSIASGIVVDALSNHMSVRVFNSRNREKTILAQQQKKIIKRWRESWWQNFVTNIVKGQSTAIVNGIAMVLVLKMFIAGEVQVGDIVLFLAYFTDASSSLWELAWSLDSYYRSFGTINNALNGLKKGEPEREGVENIALPTTSDIVLNGVDFAYPDQKDILVLRGVNVAIKSGERVGLVGHSGAGKSTLVGLLLNFYELTSGTLSIGGVATDTLTPSQMRELIAYVPQDTNLFNRSIFENIAYARPDADKAAVEKAARDAQAYDFISKLPKGFDTIVGERGVKLSGGQRQRIAIARALLKDSPILLLDEATSALDSVSEQAIQKAFVSAMKNRTSLVVAHRLSTLRHLDRILVFDGGTIVEQGSHDDLVAKNGLYADLWRRQKDGFIGE